MEVDRTECNDLSQKEPKVLEDMKAKFQKMYEKSQAAYIDFGKAPRWMVPVKEY
jgi:hypothetical protein